jgi:hypothetical protein
MTRLAGHRVAPSTIGVVTGTDHRVDVIIPTRNRPDLTIQAVDAIRGQTYVDWHLWVVDDASTDHTAAQVEKHVAGDPRVTVLRRETHCGANPARQTALDASRAPLVATCDSDDWWEPTKLTRQVAAYDLQRRRTGKVGPILCWHDTVGQDGHRKGHVMRPRLSRSWHPFLQFNTSTPLLERSLLESVGGFATPAPYPWTTTDHLDLFLRLTTRRSVVVVPDVLVHCCHHHGHRNSDHERTRDAADEAARLAHELEPQLRDRPATRTWMAAAVAGRYLQIGDRRTAARTIAAGVTAGGSIGFATMAAIAAHYVPWAARREVQGWLSQSRS